MTSKAPHGTSLLWTPRSLLLFGTGAALLAAAVALRSPIPLFLALPLLLASPAAALAGPQGGSTLHVERETTGGPLDVVLRGSVRPADATDPNDLDVEVERPPGLIEVAPPTVRRGPGLVTFEYRWRAREPTIVVLPPPRVVWRDPTGLVERDAAVDAPPLVVERYPPELVRVGAVRLRRTMPFPGETRSRRIGAVGEFYGLREATFRDPFRRINWRASARAGRLVVNEYELDRTGDVLLLLDARGTSLGARADERLLSISRAAAAGIADSFLREKARVGLGVFGEFLDAVPLGGGRIQHVRIRSRLLATRLGPVEVPAERGAVSVSRYFPPGVTTVLFSPLADEGAAELVVHLRRRGYPTVVISPSPLPLDAAEPTLGPEEEALVGRIVRLQRRTRITQAWREAPTIDWEDYWSLGEFVELLRRPVHRRFG